MRVFVQITKADIMGPLAISPHITMSKESAVLTDDSLMKNIIASFRDWGWIAI